MGRYNRVCGKITKLANKLKSAEATSEFRIKMTASLLEKLYEMGVINSKRSLGKASAVTTAAFCRRRLAVVIVRLKFAQSVAEAARMVRQGHFRVGTNVVTDPAYHVTRKMEDHVAFVDTSSIRRKVLKYNDKLDDYELLL